MTTEDVNRAVDEFEAAVASSEDGSTSLEYRKATSRLGRALRATGGSCTRGGFTYKAQPGMVVKKWAVFKAEFHIDPDDMNAAKRSQA